MHKTVISSSVAAAAVLLSVMTAPAAFAQDDAPSCDEAKGLVVKLEGQVADKAAKERVDEKATLDAAKTALDQAKAAVTAAEKRVADAEASLKDGQTPDEVAELNNAKIALDQAKAVRDAAKKDVEKAETALAEDSNALLGLRTKLKIAIEGRDKVCDAPAAPPTTTPAPTTEPTPADQNGDELDCGDISDAEAQSILNSDRSDPNRFDADGDGIACEVAVVDDGNSASSGGVVAPSGGVATGVGPA